MMDRRWIASLTCGAALVGAVMTAPAAGAQRSGSGIMAQETIVVVPQPHSMRALIQITWAHKPSGSAEFIPLPELSSNVKLLQPAAMSARVEHGGLLVGGSPDNVNVSVVIAEASPYVLALTPSTPIEHATLLVGGNFYPSGNALSPFVYRGVLTLANRRFRHFAAISVPPGVQLFIPIAVAPPITAYKRALDAGLALLAATALSTAGWWALRPTRIVARREEGAS